MRQDYYFDCRMYGSGTGIGFAVVDRDWITEHAHHTTARMDIGCSSSTSAKRELLLDHLQCLGIESLQVVDAK